MPPVFPIPEEGYPANYKDTEVKMFNIKLDRPFHGLGVTVKGMISITPTGRKDHGIFIESVSKGLSASKDGRLQVNDQLLGVNNFTLTNMSNVKAFKQLRQAISNDGQEFGLAMLTIARNNGDPSMFQGNTFFNDVNE